MTLTRRRKIMIKQTKGPWYVYSDQMRKMKLFAASCLTLCLSFGVMGVAHAVVSECYDAVGVCNDIKVIYTDGNINQGGYITHVFGREYGCGKVDRGFTGVIKKTSTQRHIILTGMWNPTTYYQVGAIHINLNNSSKTSGPGNYTYISGAVSPATTIHGATTYTRVTCPASSNALGEPSPQEERMSGPDITLDK
jgi:hypothetical protein